jgi:ATP-dependent DNA helicase RecG
MAISHEPSSAGEQVQEKQVACRDLKSRAGVSPALGHRDGGPTPLAAPVTQLWGVGPERAEQLARLKIHTIGDLLLHRPRRHEDRRHFTRIRELEVGRPATVRGTVVALGVKYYRQRTKSVFELIVDDGTARLHGRWWNLPFMEKYFHQGEEVFVFGKPISLRPRTMDHPETEVVEAGEDSSIHLGRIVPVYPLTEGLPQRWLRSLMWRTLKRFEAQIPEPWPAGLLPDLPPRAQAIRQLHFPEHERQAQAARQRLALDEFIELQLAIQRRRRHLQTHARALPCGGTNRLIKPFLSRLGFQLTAAQTRVLREIRRDLSGGHPMRRLVQGDVGSGKTVVAACAALMALESGFNVALMAPTEILAEQHYGTFRRWLEPQQVPVELQTGSRKTTLAKVPSSKLKAQEAGASLPRPAIPPTPSLFIGTHALIESSFDLPNLGLVIIDEQHKFGVAQRETLVRKGTYPHLLVMTATPIPRTLGLTLYGDLDISVIDELPAGRGRVRTFVRGVEELPKVHAFIRQKLGEGRQAYIVMPRVDEADLRTGTKAVTQEYERLQKEFAPFRLGLLHGRLPAAEKERVMAAFRANEIHLLLATSVIEVGVDVANATVMLVENAEQFGLAQLHQLRGRIGRGAHESYCILVADLKTPEARGRLNVLQGSNNGFTIAEADLALRGPGELLGREQSGLPAFRFGDLAKDLALVERARSLAGRLLDSGFTGSSSVG